MRKTVLALALLASGCASYTPVVDMRGVDRRTYAADLDECQGYATQRSAGGTAAAGAVAGAVFGALLGAAIGNHSLAQRGAGVGALYGVAGGAAAGADSQIDIVRRCMHGRGYAVLN